MTSAARTSIGLIGREGELKAVEDVLVSGSAALALISGEPGIGKSALLQTVARWASEGGWTVLSPAGGEPSLVSYGTTADMFSKRVGELLQRVPGTAAPSGTAKDIRLQPIVERLCSVAPSLLVIDDFRADRRFTGWFERSFLKELKAESARTVVLLGGMATDLRNLTRTADLKVDLQPLQAQAVRAHFEAVGSRLDPPVDGREIGVYVSESRGVPRILGGLTRVLELAAVE